MSELEVSVMTEDMAREICSWRYEGEYSVYNFSDWEVVVDNGWDLSIKEEREKHFIGISNNKELMAFGRISFHNGVCILGVGLKPSWCGKSFGKEVMKLLINESRIRYPGSIISLEVRTFNERAIKCYENLGFVAKYRYVRSIDGAEVEFYYMEYEQKDI